MSLATLVVEDDATTRTILETVLRGRGYAVTSVGDAESAWPHLQTADLALILLDWVLPGMDGVTLCRQFRELPHGDRSVIVMLTARDRPEDLRAVMDAGADDYLAKPLDIPQLTIRLEVAERQVDHLRRRKQAEDRTHEVLDELRRSHDDLLSVLNLLRLGSVVTDGRGQVTFLSDSGRKLFGPQAAGMIGQPWTEVFPFGEDDRRRLKETSESPSEARRKLAVQLQSSNGRPECWIEVEVKDDPRDARRKIFFLYDISEVHSLRRQLDEKAQFQGLVGRSPAMQALINQIRNVSHVDSTVLIEGETGTGKELVARAIHQESRRAGKPFVAVNCAGLTESILGSQLFGHRRGAFTGAIEDHKGLFEAAEGGTIFLDEIGDIPLPVQTNLLRVLQEREIVRLGESMPRKIDVRVLAATHHDLVADVARGVFRSDLFYRIRVARITVPPLRQRLEDVPLLATAFLGQHCAATGRKIEQIDAEAMRLLMNYPWPGNVRELSSAIEFAVIGCTQPAISRDDLPDEIGLQTPGTADRSEEPEDEAQRILWAIKKASGNRALAARLLGMSRATFYRRLTELGILPK